MPCSAREVSARSAEAARAAALQQMNRVLQRLQKAIYTRSWNKWVAGVFARKSQEDAQRRALVTMNRVVQRLQKAMLTAAWGSWCGMVLRRG